MGRAQRYIVRQSVTNGNPQGSILETGLFNIFINKLDTGIKCIQIKFADDSKLGAAIDSLESREILKN